MLSIRSIVRAAVLTSVACGFAPLTTFAAIEIDVDENFDFSVYKTFVVEEGTPPRTERASIEMAAAVQHAVEQRGLRVVATNADVIVRTHVLVDTHSLEELADENQWEFWTGVRNISAYELGEGTLVVDFIDAASGRIVWRGLTTERLSGATESTYKRIPKFVRRLIDRYPGP